ncbi:MAG: insulinase family protein, partial [Acidobacteriota bacterium]|nr:insulinase family protein [Acidobacteriota bacterium]
MNLKKFSRTLLAALALTMFASTTTPAQSAPSAPPQKQTPPEGGPPKAFTLPRKQEFSLPNGLRVTMVPYGAIPKVTVAAYVNTGNINETAEQIAQEAARMGGGLNLGAGLDQTTASIDVLSENGPAAVALVADVLQN